MGERFAGTLAVAPSDGGAHERENDIEDAEWDAAARRWPRAIEGRDGRAEPARVSVRDDSVCVKRFDSIPARSPATGVGSPFWRIPPAAAKVAISRSSISVSEGSAPLELTDHWRSARGLAWSPDGRELWFAAGESRSNRALRAVTPQRVQRVVLNAPGSLTLWDIAADGRVLLTRDDERRVMIVGRRGYGRAGAEPVRRLRARRRL